MGIGYGIKKARLLRTEDMNVLITIIIYLMLPCFVFDAIYTHHQAIPLSIAKVPLVGFGIELVVICIAYFAGRVLKLDRPTRGGLILAAVFGNTGFLGYPIVQAAFGKSALITATLYDGLAMALPLYTLGMVIAARFAGEKVDRMQLLKMAALPAIWAIPLALLLRPVTLPEPILRSIGYLANGTVPLAMLSIGLSISARSIKGLAIPIVAACALKLVVLPLITFYAARTVGISGLVQTVTVIEAGMPSAAMACVVAAKFGANERFVAGIIFVSTLLSLITIPAMLVILGPH